MMWMQLKATVASAKLVIQVAVVSILLIIILFQAFALKSRDIKILTLTNQVTTMQKASAEKLAEAQAKVRKAEQSLQTQAAKSRQELQSYEQTLSRQRAGLLARVRAAEARARARVPQATATPSAGEASPGDPGVELLGTIGEEHVEEAVRADLIRKHLIECYRQYDYARSVLNE